MIHILQKNIAISALKQELNKNEKYIDCSKDSSCTLYNALLHNVAFLLVTDHFSGRTVSLVCVCVCVCVCVSVCACLSSSLCPDSNI